MEQVFEKIIDIENRAKEVYADAIDQKNQMKEVLQQEILQRGNEIREMADSKIRQLTASGKKDVDDKLDRINHQIQDKLSQLEAEASKNAIEWEDLIFSRIIGD